MFKIFTNNKARKAIPSKSKNVPITDVNKLLREQDSCMDKLRAAKTKYESDNDLHALVKTYQHVFCETGVYLNAQSHALYPAELCIRNKEFDLAWQYLNNIMLTNSAPVNKIRHLQAQILKKEKKYSEALEFCLLEHKAKYAFNKNAFDKDIKAYASKLNLNQEQIDHLEHIVTSCKDENSLILKYRAVIDSWRT